MGVIEREGLFSARLRFERFSAAILAGVGVGAYPAVPDACDRLLSKKLVEQPDPARSAAYEPYYRLYRTLYGSLKDANHALAAL